MTSTARAGRRRRMLHEGSMAPAPTGGEPHSTERRRYTPPETSVSFAVASRVAPRSPLALLTLALMGGAVIAGLAWADGFGVALAQANVAAARVFMIDQPGALARWWETSMWLAVAVQSVLLFGMRRHRTDDTRGAYRWWLFVAAVATGMSVNAATQAHAVVAAQAAALTGFSPLAGGVFWWLVPGGFVLSIVAIRSLLEVKESVMAGVLGVLAVAVTGVSWTFAAGLAPAALTQATPVLASPLVAPIAALAGVTLVLLTLLVYSRRIIRETLGEVAVPKPAEKPVEREDAEESKPVEAKKPRRTAAVRVAMQTTEPEPAPRAEPERVPTAAERRAAKKRAMQAAEETQWVSGPEGDDDYDDGPKQRKLSKAERKRLRREKARRAA